MPDRSVRAVWPLDPPPPEAVAQVLATAVAYHPSTSETAEHDGGPNNAQTLARRLQSWDLRVGGLSFRAIAKLTGVSPSTAYIDVQMAGDLIKDVRAKMAEKVLDIEVERSELICRHMLQRVIEKGDPRAAQAYIHACEHRAKLLGIYQPEKVVHAGLVVTQEEMSAGARALQQKLEALAQRMLSLPATAIPMCAVSTST